MSRKRNRARSCRIQRNIGCLSEPEQTDFTSESPTVPKGGPSPESLPNVWTEICSISSDKLELDMRYQRPTDAARVKRIVEEFDPALVNILKVSLREGRYYVFDGGHTLAVLKEVKKKPSFPVLCQVFHGLTYEQEALLFAKQRGDAKDVGIPYKLRAMAEGGEKEIIDFLSTTAKAGFTITPGNIHVRDGSIAAVKTAYDIYHRIGHEMYFEVLTLAKAAWQGESWSVSQNMMRGMAEFVVTYEDTFKISRFIGRLQGISRSAMERAASKYYGMSPKMAYAAAITTFYNKGGGCGTLDLSRLAMKN